MAVELGGILLEHLTSVSVRERARIARHDVPGMSGDLAQTLGRSSVEVSLQGLFYGAGALDDLNLLRDAYLGNEPVDFFTESVGEGYFTRVLISRLEVFQRAGYLDQFGFACDVVEYVEPPEPALLAPLVVPDTELLDEAASFMDDVQNGLEEASQLVGLLNLPSFQNPVSELPSMSGEYVQLVGDVTTPLADIRDLLLGTPD